LADSDAHGPDSRLERGCASEIYSFLRLRFAMIRLLWLAAIILISFEEAPVRTEVIRRDESASVSLL
jgi:hypothetical protein